MAIKDDNQSKATETEEVANGRKKLDLGEVEDLAGGSYDPNKPIELPEI